MAFVVIKTKGLRNTNFTHNGIKKPEVQDTQLH